MPRRGRPGRCDATARFGGPRGQDATCRTRAGNRRPTRTGSIEPIEPTSSQRDPDAIGAALTAWLRDRPDAPDDVALVEVHKPDGNGMSSDTVLFTVRWDGADRPLVARVEPQADDVPVFPSYDLEMQRRVMALVSDQTTAPVPAPVFALMREMERLMSGGSEP